jgi:hypothetical protein
MNNDSFLDGLLKNVGMASGTLAVGVLGNDAGTNFVEGFFKVESKEDLPNMFTLGLRARFNLHRNMRIFYFKTDEFKKLHKRFMNGNEDFADWVVDTKSIKKEEIDAI